MINAPLLTLTGTIYACGDFGEFPRSNGRVAIKTTSPSTILGFLCSGTTYLDNDESQTLQVILLYYPSSSIL